MPRLRLPALLLAAALVSEGATAADAPPVNLVPTLSGYAQVQFGVGLDGTGDGIAPTAGVLLRRLRLRIKGQVFAGVGYTVMIDPSTPANLARDAYVSLTVIPRHEIRLGQQKTQFGYENPESTVPAFVVNRAYVSEALGRGPDLRDLGIGVFGTWSLPAGFGLDYQVTAVQGAGPNVLVDDTPRKNVWGRAGGSYSGSGWTVKAGLSGAIGDRLFRGNPATMTPDQRVSFTRLGVDVRADTPWFFAAAEGMLGTNDPGTGDNPAAGFSAQVAGKTPWNLGPVARVEFLDPNQDVSGDILRRSTLGMYLDLRHPEQKTAWARWLVNVELDRSEARRDHALLSWVQVVF